MKIDHILGHKEKFNIIPKADTAKASLFDRRAIKLEIINKSLNWKANHLKIKHHFCK